MEKRGIIINTFLGLVLFSLAFSTLTQAAPPAAISVSPSTVVASLGESFTIEINIDPESAEIYGAQYDLYFDQNILNATSQSQGTFLSQDGESASVFANRANNSIGKIEYGEAIMGAEHGVTNPGTLATISFDVIGTGTTELKLNNVILSDPNATVIQSDVINGRVEVESTEFDTGSSEQPYPAISGTHHGTITPNVTIRNVSRLYTYPCPGTGGHTEYVAFYYSNGTKITEGHWNGHNTDGYNISFPVFTLFKNHTYRYELKTGSYPQVHHTQVLEAEGGMGTINCTSFVDANGRSYYNRIPAIRLDGGST